MKLETWLHHKCRLKGEEDQHYLVKHVLNAAHWHLRNCRKIISKIIMLPMSRLLLLNLDPMWKLSILNSTSYKISSMTYFSPSLRTDWIISEEWKGTAQDFNREESIQKGADSKQHQVISRGNLWSPYCLASCKHMTHRLETLKQLTRRSTLKHS